MPTDAASYFPENLNSNLKPAFDPMDFLNFLSTQNPNQQAMPFGMPQQGMLPFMPQQNIPQPNIQRQVLPQDMADSMRTREMTSSGFRKEATRSGQAAEDAAGWKAMFGGPAQDAIRQGGVDRELARIQGNERPTNEIMNDNMGFTPDMDMEQRRQILADRTSARTGKPVSEYLPRDTSKDPKVARGAGGVTNIYSPDGKIVGSSRPPTAQEIANPNVGGSINGQSLTPQRQAKAESDAYYKKIKQENEAFARMQPAQKPGFFNFLR